MIAELKRILLAEDNANDVELTLTALRENKVLNEVVVVRDGAEALDYLYKREGYKHRSGANPVLVLLDLKMPKMTGLDVLRWIRSQPALQGLRVIIYSSSRLPLDINAAHALRIDAYVVKPGTYDEWVAMVDNLNVYWLKGR